MTINDVNGGTVTVSKKVSELKYLLVLITFKWFTKTIH
jgi:hypothetical protein